MSFAVGLILMIPLVWQAWTIGGPSAYAGADGKALQAGILAFRKFASPFEINILLPLQEFASFATPINIWANPVLWPFFFDDLSFATQASTMVAYVALATAIFALAQALRLPLGSSIAGALSAVIIIPPFFLISGFITLFAIIPHVGMNALLAMIAAMLAYRVQVARAMAVIGTGVLMALILGYAVYVDPGWFVGSVFVFMPLFAFCILDAPSLKVSAARISAFIVAFLLLYAIGLVDYVRMLFSYSARVYLASEWPRPQDLLFASWTFVSPFLKWTYLIFLMGWLLGMLFGGKPARKIASLCLILFAVFLLEAGLYIFASFEWMGTLPVYYEVLVAPIYVLAAFVGYSSFATAVWRQIVLAGGSFAREIALPPASRRLRATFPLLIGIAFVPAVALWFNSGAIYGTRYTPGLVNSLNEPWPSNPELIKLLRTEIGLEDDQRFRGTALVPNVEYRSQLIFVTLWKEGIPTLVSSTTFQSPLSYYLLKWGPKRSTDELSDGSVSIENGVFWTGSSTLNRGSAKLLQALGVRYLLQPETPDRPEPEGPPQGDVRFGVPPFTVGGVSVRFHLYEFDRPNVGDYSPTQIIVMTNALSTLQMMWQPSFNPQNSVILTERLEVPIVPALGAELKFERSAIHVNAKSAGQSLLLLPLQYSRCLALEPADKGKLLRANLVQAGLLFEGDLDVRIRLRYGIFQPGCRKEDLADLVTLGIFNEERPDIPWLQRHPHGISSMAEFPAALKAVVGKTAVFPALQPATEPAPEESAPSKPVITKEAVLADLPRLTTAGFAFVGIQGLNAEPEVEDPVVAGQPPLRLVAVPTTGRHYLAAQSTTLNKNQVYRITAWVKGSAGVKVEMQVSDELKPVDRVPANYGSALFHPAARTVLSSSGFIKGRGIEQGPNGWQKVWVDLATAGGELVLGFGLVSKNGSSFKGDGRFGLTFGGIEVAERK
jgi:hypothetical protein